MWTSGATRVTEAQSEVTKLAAELVTKQAAVDTAQANFDGHKGRADALLARIEVAVNAAMEANKELEAKRALDMTGKDRTQHDADIEAAQAELDKLYADADKLREERNEILVQQKSAEVELSVATLNFKAAQVSHKAKSKQALIQGEAWCTAKMNTDSIIVNARRQINRINGVKMDLAMPKYDVSNWANDCRPTPTIDPVPVISIDPVPTQPIIAVDPASTLSIDTSGMSMRTDFNAVNRRPGVTIDTSGMNIGDINIGGASVDNSGLKIGAPSATVDTTVMNLDRETRGINLPGGINLDTSAMIGDLNIGGASAVNIAVPTGTSNASSATVTIGPIP